MRAVMHWDGDSFFASIEQASDRRLRGRALIVGGDKRGVVLSASREARRFGLRAGMTTARVRRICPHVVIVPAHFDLYEQFSSQILGLCEESTPLVEPAGVGAAWMDLTGTGRVLGRGAPETAQKLRRTVWDWLRVPLSFGLSTNKTVARIAARIRKPAAMQSVPSGGEGAFLAPLSLRWLPGVGEQTRAALEVAGVQTVGQLAAAPVELVHMAARGNGLPLVRRAQGVDEEPVRRPATQTQAWKETVEFSDDVWEQDRLRAALKDMTDRLMARLRAAESDTRKLTLTLRYTDRAESERSASIAEPCAVETSFYPLLHGLLDAAWSRRVRVRALTLRPGPLYPVSRQLQLFTPDAANAVRQHAVSSAIDHLRRQFGEGIVMRGAGRGAA